MAMQTRYAFGTKVTLPYQHAVRRTTELLKEEGFGVLTEIDVRKTMREKLSADFRPYIILGACNPHLAHRAFQVELGIGVLLPCNVVVYQEGDSSVVSVMDPRAALEVTGNDALRSIAEEARARLERVIQKLATM